MTDSQPLDPPPWTAAPTMDSFNRATRRASHLEAQMVAAHAQGTADASSEHMREHALLVAWLEVARAHLLAAQTPAHRPLLDELADALVVRTCDEAMIYLYNAERETFTDRQTGRTLVLYRSLSLIPGTEAREVWAARPLAPASEQDVVVKRLVRDANFERLEPMRYRREFVAQTVATKFGHPGLLPLLGYFESRARSFAVLPMLRRSLYDLIAQQFTAIKRGLDEPDVKDIFRKMLQPVRALAALGMAHRDLSLDNFCLALPTDETRIVLIDFGHCTSLRLVDGNSGAWRHVPHEYKGKLPYMSPETFHGTSTDTMDALAADVWSLGICLFELATGLRPSDRPAESTDKDNRYRLLVQQGARGVILDMVDKGDMTANIYASSALLDLLNRMLRVDPASRIALQDIERHRFLAS